MATKYEHRGQRPYDERDPSTLIMPNGSHVCSYDRAFLNVAARLVLELWSQ